MVDAAFERLPERLENHRGRRHDQTGYLCPLAACNPRLSQHGHIANRPHRTGSAQVDDIAFGHLGGAERFCAAQPHQRGVHLSGGQQDVRYTKPILARHQANIAAQQLGIVQANRVVGINHRISRRVGARDQGDRQQIGRRGQVSVAAGREIERATQIPYFGAVDADRRAHHRLLVGVGARPRIHANRVDTYLVGDVGVGIGVDLKHPDGTRCGLHQQIRTALDRHVGTKSVG